MQFSTGGGRPAQSKVGRVERGVDKTEQYPSGQGNAVTTQRLRQVKAGHSGQERTREDRTVQEKKKKKRKKERLRTHHERTLGH